MTTSVTRIRARYAETDQMGVVYHANYLIWMEVARVEYCREAGIRYRDLESEHGVLLAVTDVGCRYISPARYDEEVEITTRVRRATHRSLVFEYEMRAAVAANGAGDPGRRIATGHSSHIFLNRELRPTTLPAEFRERFGLSAGG
jgi:acyl-CoA thioester hydrolase